MIKKALVLCSVLSCFAVFALLSGCGDDVRKTKSVERHEQEPVKMTSPGEEVVE